MKDVGRRESERHKRIDKLPPPLLAILALQPFLVHLCELLVRVFRQFRKCLERMLEYLVVQPGRRIL